MLNLSIYILIQEHIKQIRFYFNEIHFIYGDLLLLHLERQINIHEGYQSPKNKDAQGNKQMKPKVC